jgi:siroheme synthase (precorrin-2 oxidase/ferrochelatase)
MRRIAALAESRGLLVNVVDRGDLGNFIVPATIDRGSVTVAIGPGGALPGLASELRHLIEDALPDHVDRIAQFATEFRQAAEIFLPEVEMRRRRTAGATRTPEGRWRSRACGCRSRRSRIADAAGVGGAAPRRHHPL